MKCIEYGTEHAQTLIFLHGGGLSWWNFREEAELLGQDYHVILPILDGHAGSDLPFTGIETNAAELIAWIERLPGRSVALIGGLSLGGQILLEMLSQRHDICRHAFVESAMVIPSRFTHALIAPVFGSSYPLIQNRSFARLQFRSLHMKPNLFDDYYRDTCAIRKSDFIAFMQASTAYSLHDALQRCNSRVHLWIGSKEHLGIRRSADLLRNTIPNSTLNILPGYVHGDFSLNHAREYVLAVRNVLEKEIP